MRIEEDASRSKNKSSPLSNKNLTMHGSSTHKDENSEFRNRNFSKSYTENQMQAMRDTVTIIMCLAPMLPTNKRRER